MSDSDELNIAWEHVEILLWNASQHHNLAIVEKHVREAVRWGVPVAVEHADVAEETAEVVRRVFGTFASGGILLFSKSKADESMKHWHWVSEAV